MDLAWKLGSALVLTLIIAANLWERGNPRTEVSRFLWQRVPLLGFAGLGFLAILVAFSLVDAAILAGWAGPAAMDVATPLLGIPMALLAIAVLVLSGRAIAAFLKAH